jgi:hypothetical protein
MHKFDDLVKLSCSKTEGEPYEVDCDITVYIEGRPLKAYTASIAHRDFLLYCDKGTATYVIDMYGDMPSAELFDYEFDEE